MGKKLLRFSREFKNWTMADDDRYSITSLSTSGVDFEDFLANAELSIEDWHGNCARESWCIEDLSAEDYAQVCELFAEFFHGSIEYGEVLVEQD